MKKPPPIIEPREPVDHPVVVADNVEPQPIHAGVGTEEPVRSQVDRLAPQIKRAGQPANAFVGLEDKNVGAAAAELQRRGHAGRSRANHSDSHVGLQCPFRRIAPAAASLRPLAAQWKWDKHPATPVFPRGFS